jgi:hypothetical protein
MAIQKTVMEDSQYDAEQVKFMNEEYCILVDENDEIIGQDTKKNCNEFYLLLMFQAI